MSDRQHAKTTNLDARAKASLNAALDEFLSGLVVLNDTPDIFDGYHAMESFLTQLRKYEPWRSHIRFFDFYEILSFFFKKFEITAGIGKEARLADLLSAKRFQEFKKDLHTFLLSLPRRYEITVELPSMPRWGAGEIRLTSRLTIVEIAPSVDTAKALSGAAPSLVDVIRATIDPKPTVFARVHGLGYGSGRLDTTAVADALSHLKQVFSLFRRIEPYQSASRYLEGVIGGAKIKCEVIEPEYGQVSDIDLPENIRRFLWKVSLDNKKLKTFHRAGRTLLGGDWKEADTRAEREEALFEKSRWITNLMDCPPGWPDAERIRTAAEWSLDSQENENETFAFIQACIGLEALLGDDDKEEPLTARLADRCAYLLGKSYKDRAKIRENFKGMYDVRSKLIHGRSPKLNLADAEQLHFAQAVLTDVITAEANLLLGALDAEKKRLERPK